MHRSYIQAGAEVIVTNTFGANRPRLAAKRMSGRLEKINRLGVQLAKKAAGCSMRAARAVRVWASIGPLGTEARKMSGPVMIRYFREQVRALDRERPNGYLVETMISLAEAEAAARAVREISDRTLCVLMTIPVRRDRTSVKTMELISGTLRGAGADRIGVNCGLGPQEVYDSLKILSHVDAGPFCARPAAGRFPDVISPRHFAAWAKKINELGVDWIGGCCGTTPAHIRAIRSAL